MGVRGRRLLVRVAFHSLALAAIVLCFWASRGGEDAAQAAFFAFLCFAYLFTMRINPLPGLIERAVMREASCPHCGEKMKIWQCSETGLVCGSGWGTPYLFVCVNEECPLFVEGWTSMKEHYGRTCSYRCICYPESQTTEMMLVYSSSGLQTGIIDEETIAADDYNGGMYS